MSSTGRIPPHDMHAERSVLGGVLLANAAMPIVVDLGLGTEEFYRDAHGVIFEAMLSLHRERLPIDHVTLRETLSVGSKLERVGGDEYLLQLTDTIPTVANIVAHARIVKEKALVRRLIHACYEQIARGYDDYGQVEEYVEEAEKAIVSVTRERFSGVNVLSALEVADRALQHIQVASTSTDESLIIRPAFAVMRDAIRAYKRKSMHVVGGRTGCRKSSLMLSDAAWIARNQGHKPGFVMVEDPDEEVGERLLAFAGGVNPEELQDGQLGFNTVTAIENGRIELAKLGVSFVFEYQATPQVVCKAIRALVAKGCNVIYVDHLHAMRIRLRNKNDRIDKAFADASQDLKSTCQELGVPLILGAQCKRVEGPRAYDEPTMWDLKETGDLENAAESITLLWKTSDREDAEQLGKVAKVKGSNKRPRFVIESTEVGSVCELRRYEPPAAEPSSNGGGGYKRRAKTNGRHDPPPAWSDPKDAS